MRIVPSILSADWSRIVDELEECSQLGITQIHLDVMDGSFVPSISFGPKFIEHMRQHTKLVFDTHIMIEAPEKHVDSIISAGSDMLTFHIEATRYAIRLINHIRNTYRHVAIGIALNPQTSIQAVEHIVDLVDLVLLMSVEPGFGGQNFIASVNKKIEQLNTIRQINKYKFKISLDGGVTEGNAKELIQLGVDTLVMGSSFFGSDDKPSLIHQILNYS